MDQKVRHRWQVGEAQSRIANAVKSESIISTGEGSLWNEPSAATPQPGLALNSSAFARPAARQQNAVVRQMSCGLTPDRPQRGSASGHGSAWKVSCPNWAFLRSSQ